MDQRLIRWFATLACEKRPSRKFPSSAAAGSARLFEAARAPSTHYEQKWRFRYAHRASGNSSRFFELLFDANKLWCKDAGVLVARDVPSGRRPIADSPGERLFRAA